MIQKEAKERFLSTDLYMTMKKRMKQKNSETIEMLLKFIEMKEARKDDFYKRWQFRIPSLLLFLEVNPLSLTLPIIGKSSSLCFFILFFIVMYESVDKSSQFRVESFSTSGCQGQSWQEFMQFQLLFGSQWTAMGIYLHPSWSVSSSRG